MTTDIGVTPTQVYATNAATRSTIIGINIANTTADTVFVDITFTDEMAATGYIVKGAEIPSGASLAAIGGDQKLVLDPTNSISVTSNTATSVDVIVSAVEIS